MQNRHLERLLPCGVNDDVVARRVAERCGVFIVVAVGPQQRRVVELLDFFLDLLFVWLTDDDLQHPVFVSAHMLPCLQCKCSV